ncbi:MAG: hypothetical protein IPP74_15895 [Alphaproteobacteria bacterium]|nr:hypothetical protein [Alphaproteobacteria bacterium]
MGLRYASQVDGNQAQIVRELRAMGFRVDLVHRLKKLYDLVVTGKMGATYDVRTLRVEVKKPGETLTADEREYWEAEPYPETLIIAIETEDILRWYKRI